MRSKNSLHFRSNSSDHLIVFSYPIVKSFLSIFFFTTALSEVLGPRNEFRFLTIKTSRGFSFLSELRLWGRIGALGQVEKGRMLGVVRKVRMCIRLHKKYCSSGERFALTILTTKHLTLFGLERETLARKISGAREGERARPFLSM